MTLLAIGTGPVVMKRCVLVLLSATAIATLAGWLVVWGAGFDKSLYITRDAIP